MLIHFFKTSIVFLFFTLNSSISFTQELPEQLLNQTLKFAESKQDSLYYEIYAYYKYNNPDTAFYYAKKAFRLSKKYNNTRIYIKCLHALGFLESDRGNFNLAQEYYNKGLELSLKSNYSIGILMMLNDIGLLYIILPISCTKGLYC